MSQMPTTGASYISHRNPLRQQMRIVEGDTEGVGKDVFAQCDHPPSISL